VDGADRCRCYHFTDSGFVLYRFLCVENQSDLLRGGKMKPAFCFWNWRRARYAWRQEAARREQRCLAKIRQQRYRAAGQRRPKF